MQTLIDDDMNHTTLSPEKFTAYLAFLRNLVSIESVFINHDNIENCAVYCEETMRGLLPEWDIKRDKERNLICKSPDFEAERDAVFLSAHLDTVGAVSSMWKSSDDPFTATETDTHIIGRGANDCKAGVAFMLLLARLIGDGALNGDNICFVFSFQEEGSGRKTSVEIGAQLGRDIPISTQRNTLLCLENTVSVDTAPWCITLYDREPCNVFIEIKGTPAELKAFITENQKWKPVFIEPFFTRHSKPAMDRLVEKLSGTSGHSATVSNEENLLYAALHNYSDHPVYILSGDRAQTSIVSNMVEIYQADKVVQHSAIFNYRDIKDVDTLKEELSSVKYKECHNFEYGAGSDRKAQLQASRLLDILTSCETDSLKTRITDNPGRSDASAIWHSMAPTLHDRLCVATIGPGTRSHIDHGTARKTHGPDEGFHKDAGREAVILLLNVVCCLLSSDN